VKLSVARWAEPPHIKRVVIVFVVSVEAVARAAEITLRAALNLPVSNCVADSVPSSHLFRVAEGAAIFL
jgi:hypothetical protein